MVDDDALACASSKDSRLHNFLIFNSVFADKHSFTLFSHLRNKNDLILYHRPPVRPLKVL